VNKPAPANKLFRAAIATAAGAALLMGGAGTFAYWNSSVGITGGTISSGTLTIVDATPTDGVWTVQKNGAGAQLPVANIATFLTSPGDVLTYTKNVKISASGNNLAATLAVTPGSIVAADANPGSAPLAAKLTSSATITASGTGITANGATYTITPGSTPISAANVAISVVITFPKDAGTILNTAQNGAVNLSGLSVTLTQT
jgi:alternate signal-mediated exported protein